VGRVLIREVISVNKEGGKKLKKFTTKEKTKDTLAALGAGTKVHKEIIDKKNYTKEKRKDMTAAKE